MSGPINHPDHLHPVTLLSQLEGRLDHGSALELSEQRAELLAREIMAYKFAGEVHLKAVSRLNALTSKPMVRVNVPIHIGNGHTVELDFYHLIHPLAVFEVAKAIRQAYGRGHQAGQDDSISNLTGQLTRLMKGQDLD